jgi:hypothetical protein
VLVSIRDDLNYGLAAFGIQIPERFDFEAKAAALTDKPCQNTLALVTGAAVLFYIAERGHNPKIRDIYDALVYCTTNISVGYCDIFAHTPVGKLIGSTLMTIGPSIAAKTLDGAKESVPDGETQQQILATLREIAGKLDGRPTREE